MEQIQRPDKYNSLTEQNPGQKQIYIETKQNLLHKLEDLKALRRSPDLFNYVEIGQDQLQLIIKHILFYHIWGLQPFWLSDLKQSNEYSIKQPSDI